MKHSLSFWAAVTNEWKAKGKKWFNANLRERMRDAQNERVASDGPGDSTQTDSQMLAASPLFN